MSWHELNLLRIENVFIKSVMVVSFEIEYTKNWLDILNRVLNES